MSHQAESHKGGFHPHILPLPVYFAVGGALFVLTAVTVAVAYVDLGGAGNLIVAMLVATVKASLVAMIFMHLAFDNKLYLLCFLGSLLFLGIFIIFTMADTMRRGDIYDYRSERNANRQTIDAKVQTKIKEGDKGTLIQTDEPRESAHGHGDHSEAGHASPEEAAHEEAASHEPTEANPEDGTASGHGATSEHEAAHE